MALISVLVLSTGMHAFWPAQAVPGEQLADDGAVGSQGFNREHDAGVSRGSSASLQRAVGYWQGTGFRVIF